LQSNPCFSQSLSTDPIYHGSREHKRVALTIDDGWVDDPELLALLDHYQIPCTVFIPGRVAESRPDFVMKLAERGYEICNHTYTHRWLTRLTDDEIRQEFRKNQELLYQLTGQKHPYIRPPAGNWDRRVARIAAEEGYSLVLWDNDAMGYRDDQTKEDQLTLLRKHKRNGNIILCHFGSKLRTAEVMAILIPEMLAEGYTFVTLTDLLNYNEKIHITISYNAGVLRNVKKEGIPVWAGPPYPDYKRILFYIKRGY
jgi:peptidoglycan/xylan/chitin deacetylase (PgdA/CDA1 family)